MNDFISPMIGFIGLIGLGLLIIPLQKRKIPVPRVIDINVLTLPEYSIIMNAIGSDNHIQHVWAHQLNDTSGIEIGLFISPKKSVFFRINSNECWSVQSGMKKESYTVPFNENIHIALMDMGII